MITIRSYRTGDEEQIISLFELVFTEPLFANIEYWNWMYKNNPVNMTIAWVAEDNGKIIGHRGYVPNLMKINDRLRIGTIGTNSVVHPDYQGRGIFKALVTQARSEVNKEEIPITYHYPNKDAFPIFTKALDSIHVPSPHTLIKVLNPEGLLAGKIRNKYLVKMLGLAGSPFLKTISRRKISDQTKDINISRVHSFEDGFDAFWEQVSMAHRIITVRNKKYLTWRYIEKPNSNYTIYAARKDGNIVGYVVLCMATSENMMIGRIVDLLVLPNMKEVTYALISKAIEQFEEEKVDAISCHMHDRNYNKMLKRTGFLPIPFKTSRLCVYVHKEKDRAFFFNPTNFFLTYGDRPHEF